MRRWSWLFLVLSFSAALTGGARSAPIPQGNGQQVVPLSGRPWTILTYRPDGCSPSSLLFLFHGRGGVHRYRDDIRTLADKLCAIVVAPHFRTKSAYYQQGGMVSKGVVLPEKEWTVSVVTPLVGWAQAETGIDQYAFIAHSAGAQFLSRVAAFHRDAASRIVIANPSTYVLPSLDVRAPFGFGGVYPEAEGKARLRDYLARPVTIYLGEADTDENAEDLNKSARAMAQGRSRFERGMNTFRDAQQLAGRNGWAFNWRLVRAPGVGHDAERMFSPPEAVEALKP